MLLQPSVAYEEFVSSSAPAEIACQLRRDQKLCESGQIPSLLASYLAKHPPSLGYRDDIAHHLLPSATSSDQDAAIPRSISRLRYQSVVKGIQAHLSQLAPPGDDATTVMEFITPSTKEFETALMVLNYLSSSPRILHVTEETSLLDLRTVITSQIPLSFNTRSAYRAGNSSYRSPRKRGEEAFAQPRKCYICHTLLSSENLNSVYSSLCSPCMSFNTAGALRSLPSNLDLSGRTALVTGGRVGLGFHTALRLLRCGARVIVSSRYPCDSISRYHAVADFSSWRGRLKTIGADFRAAGDVFRLVASVKEILHVGWGTSKLDILINNAAQTLTDSIEKECEAVRREKLLLADVKSSPAFVEEKVSSYFPRIRGGTSPLLLEPLIHGDELPPSLTSGRVGGSGDGDARDTRTLYSSNPGEVDTSSVLAASLPPSSWTQSLHQIPYEDIVTAHSVNTFVPLILTRELIPLMSSETTRSFNASGFIVNVSSRESLWESNSKSSAKDGHHVHTNMSKAALNMLTITEARSSWQKWRVAINTVDPGFMSADPVYEEALRRKMAAKTGCEECPRFDESDEPVEQRKCPITFEDGAARVLWPVAVSWGKSQGKDGGKVPVGKFLKHFGGVEVDAC